MSGHTPGPWVFDGDEIHAGDVHVVCFGHDYDEYGSINGRYPWPGDAAPQAEKDAAVAFFHAEGVANAILIAAAPDLYAALREARSLIGLEYGDRALADGYWPEVKPIVARLDAAIAKAEGK